MSRKSGGFILGALVGAAVAGVSALLYAPKSGKEFRKDLSNEMDQWIEKAGEYTDYAMDRGTEMYNAAAETTQEIKVSLLDSANQLKQQVTGMVQEQSDEWAKLKKEMEESTDEFTDEMQEAEVSLKSFTEEVAEEAQKQAKETAKDVKETVNEKVEEVKK